MRKKIQIFVLREVYGLFGLTSMVLFYLGSLLIIESWPFNIYKYVQLNLFEFSVIIFLFFITSLLFLITAILLRKVTKIDDQKDNSNNLKT